MQRRRLGNSDMEISPLGFGAWAAGGGNWVYAWGPQDDRDSIAAIHRALDLGVNWIDTAAVYGFGHSEEVVGKAIRSRSEKPFVFTKCSRIPNPDGTIRSTLRGDVLRRECEESLQRLGVDRIDLYQLHWPRPPEDVEEGWETLARLREEGKVRWIGISNFDVAQMERIRKIASITSLQPPYSAIHPEAEREILPYCRSSGIGVIVYSPMRSGLLSGKMTRERIAAMPADDWRRRNPDFQEPLLTRHLALQDRLGEIGARHGVTAAVVALAWTLRDPAVTGAIVGARRPAQVDGFIPAMEFRLSSEEGDEIARFPAAS